MKNPVFTLAIAFFVIFANWRSLGAEESESPAEVSFIRDVAPILVGKCQSCHGAKTAESNYRLDTFEKLMQFGDFEMAPVTAGNLDDSEFHRLITAEDEEERMPNNGDQLTGVEIQLIDNWISQGAKFDGQDPAALIKGQLPRVAHPSAPATYSTALPLAALTFSADGGQLLVGGYHEILVWDPVAGTLLDRVGDIPQRVYGLEFSPDKSLLAVAGGSPGVSGEVQLIPWTEAPKPKAKAQILATHDDVFFDVSFRPDGLQLAAACSDGSVRVFDVATGEQTRKIDNHADWVTDLCYSADGKLLATASRDKTAKVFSAETGELIATYSGSNKPVEAVAISPDAKQVISTSGNVVRIWNVEDSKVVGDLSGFGAEVFALLTDAESVIAASADKSVRRFTLADRKQSLAITDHPHSVLSLAWHVASKRLSTGCFDGTVSLWNLEDGALLKRFVAIPPKATPAN
ncbi:MAG: hypothetical protein GXP24_00735 [Planctomycetes bacterium]|nr:hypothetical protein [Planctomycetota bacterium]